MKVQGVYPTAVLVLVHQAKSLDEHMFTSAPDMPESSSKGTPPRQVSLSIQFLHPVSSNLSQFVCLLVIVSRKC